MPWQIVNDPSKHLQVLIS